MNKYKFYTRCDGWVYAIATATLFHNATLSWSRTCTLGQLFDRSACTPRAYTRWCVMCALPVGKRDAHRRTEFTLKASRSRYKQFKWVTTMHLCISPLRVAHTFIASRHMQPASHVKCKYALYDLRLLHCSVFTAHIERSTPIHVRFVCVECGALLPLPLPLLLFSLFATSYFTLSTPEIILHTQSASHRVRWLLLTGMPKRL